MTDLTINRYVASGTQSQRLAFTPAPATPASGPNPLCIWYETDTGYTYLSANAGAWVRVNDGLPWKPNCRAATTGTLAANTYANGTSGVGATLTANANGALAAQDGVTLVVNDRLLVKNEATGANNGIYVLTQVGSVSLPYILTRTTDADSGAELVNAVCKISEGSTLADQEWQCTTNAAITVGTTAQTWAVAGGGGGSGITALTGDVTASGSGSVAATLATSGVTAGTYTAANITVDAKGRVTAASNGAASASIRSSNIQSSSATTFTASFPAGAAAGDRIVILAGSGFGFVTPAGWTDIDRASQSNFLGNMFTRVLTTSDITLGSVTLTQGGAFNAVIAVICFTGAPTIKNISSNYNATGAGTRAVTIATGFTATDVAVYFGFNRNASTNTNSLGSAVQSINAANASGVVTSGVTGATSITNTVTYGTSSGTTGDYQGIIVLSV